MEETLSPIIEPIIGETKPELTPEIETVAPKRRGRPPGSKNATAAKLEEKPIDNKSGVPETKRGRPRKTENYGDEARARFAKQVQGIHVMAAQLSGFAEFQISDPESSMLADAIINTSQEYGLSLSGKTGALLQLLGTAAIIYIPRFSVINQKVKARKAQVVDVQPVAANG